MANETGEPPLAFDSPAQQFYAGLQWDAHPGKKGILSLFNTTDDLDLSCILVDAQQNVIDCITPSNPRTGEYQLQILHTGDGRDGKTSYDDEEVRINLAKLDPAVGGIIFLVSSKNGHPLPSIEKPLCHFVEGTSYRKFLSVDLKQYAPKGEATPFAVAYLRRTPAPGAPADGWTLSPLLKYADSPRVRGNEQAIVKALGLPA
jgi:stress response protein SCP2